MTDFVLVLVIAGIVGGALAYIRKEKKRGARCVGCPDGGTCGGKCGSCSNEGE
ncbi:MAG: FeoB-associated Cys-rich membrane protein [Roseburia sp.]|nr:FeoB-associated Cys-rich membrane protein [Roseburia sp.]